MPKFRVKNPQTAQGIVEFALVLPVLLLVIFGVIGFGHLFFSYTAVVSASREAARWGSAVGVTDSLRPRYRDCHGIRATAVRMGSFAGVTAVDSPDAATPGVAISFDHGPNDTNPDYDDCTDDIGPVDVAYGDRINVRVTVAYRPIVPLVNIPTFPMNATTSRTIIKSLPVGDRPTAKPACPSTTIIIEMLHSNEPVILPAWPQVNEPVDVRVRVIASDGTSPTGTVDIYDTDPLRPDVIHTCTVNASSTGVTCGLEVLGVPPKNWPSPPLVPEGYPDIGTKFITAHYNPGTACYQPSELIDEPFDIIKADTIVTITLDDPDPSWPNSLDPDPATWAFPVRIEFTVAPEFPAGALPDGGLVTVSDQVGRTCSTFITDGAGFCILYPFDTVELIALYAGDSNFNPSPPSVPEPHTIRVAATNTPTLTPTPDVSTTITPTPTKTATPITCPFLVGDVDFSPQNAAQFQISNENGGNTTIESIELSWPEDPTAKLREVRFGTLANLGACTSGPKAAEQNCLWQAPDALNSLNPPQQTLNSKTRIWTPKAADLNGGNMKFMYYLFNAPPPPGSYYFTIRFKNNCVLEIPAGY